MSIESKRLAEFSVAVRESTFRRLRAVPEGKENWRICEEAMSFADTAQHLVECDLWLFRKLEVKDLAPITGTAHAIEIGNRKEYLDLLDQLKKFGRSRRAMIEMLSDTQLDERIYDSRFGGEVTAWWIIIRGNLDHEIHHRGQIAAYLRAAGR